MNDDATKSLDFIREIKPQVVLTFDPVGGYHHPDHIHAHNAAVQAFHAAGDHNYAPNGRQPYQPGKLYFHVFPRGFIRFLVKVLKIFGQDTTRFGRNKDINLDTLAGDEDYPALVVINYRKVSHLKDQASACHECHRDMYLPVDIFDHHLHQDKLGGNLGCGRCHHDPDLPKIRKNTTACQECHREMRPPMKPGE